MRGISVALALLGVAFCYAQVDKTADEWLQKSFQAYNQLQSLQSKTTLTVLMVTPRYPEARLSRSTCTLTRLKPPRESTCW